MKRMYAQDVCSHSRSTVICKIRIVFALCPEQITRKEYIIAKFGSSLVLNLASGEDKMVNLSRNFDSMMAGLSLPASPLNPKTWAEDVVLDIMCHIMCVSKEIFVPATHVIRTLPVGLGDDAEPTHSFAVTFKDANHWNFLKPGDDAWVPWLDWEGFKTRMVRAKPKFPAFVPRTHWSVL